MLDLARGPPGTWPWTPVVRRPQEAENRWHTHMHAYNAEVYTMLKDDMYSQFPLMNNTLPETVFTCWNIFQEK